MRILEPRHLTTADVKFISRVLLWAALPLALFVAAAMSAFAEKPLQTSLPAREHRVVILIDSDDEKIMGHAISYSMNIGRAHALRNEKVKIEIVANGAGIKLFRADTSPLRRPLAILIQPRCIDLNQRVPLEEA